MRKFLFSLVLAALALASPVFFASPGRAALSVDVTQGTAKPLPIAIPDFIGAAPMGANIASVVRADLERSGLFQPIDPKAFVDHITNINTVPNFANWRVINAQGLVAGSVSLQPDGRLKVEFRLWDVY